MKVVQAYIQGARHKTENCPCEDRTYSLSQNGVDVIALADGAGSIKYTHSANGAECVTKTICEFFCNNFDKFYEKNDVEELKEVFIAVCKRALIKLANELDLDDVLKLSSTLISVAIKGDKVIVCHIGDGVVGKLTTRGTQIVSSPDNGEFIGTTYFVTSPNATSHVNIIKETTDDAISYFLMSDGMQEHVYNKFTGSFFDAARKMALMPLEKDGQSKLVEIIEKYIVEPDPKSDDCSFICLTFDATFDTQSIFVSKENSEIISSISEENNNDFVDSVGHYKQHNNIKNKWLIIGVSSLLVVSVVVFTVFFFKKHNKKEQVTTTKKTTVAIQQQATENTTEPIGTTKTNEETTAESSTASSETSATSSVE